ncbi:nitrate reductase cytochrome c-type subunit [Paraferrimonas haliotis]|nr:nitrate reductase cytochrome c-type subunit [Paraferrimonas haliotis]
MKPSIVLASLALVLSLPASANNGGVNSLRGNTELNQQAQAEQLKKVVEQDKPYASSYVYQPPLIPHKTRHYEMSLNANKCLSCHSWKNARDSGATKISVTHYQAREGEVLADMSPRRYFCLQCHVTQADAQPLVENQFQAVDSLRQ